MDRSKEPLTANAYCRVVISVKECPEGIQNCHQDGLCITPAWLLILIFSRSVMLLLSFSWSPRALEDGPGEHQHLLVVGRDDSKWG